MTNRELMQPVQEPVAWATRLGEYAHIHWGAKRPEYPVRYEVPLYTAPPRREWVGLTEEEIRQAYFDADEGQELAEYIIAFARAIEAAHGIKE